MSEEPGAQVKLETVDDARVVGEIGIVVKPGTKADAQRRVLDLALIGPLTDAATSLGAVLVATPSAFTTARPGKDAEGRTWFDVRGRVEGDQLIPSRPAKPRGA